MMITQKLVCRASKEPKTEERDSRTAMCGFLVTMFNISPVLRRVLLQCILAVFIVIYA